MKLTDEMVEKTRLECAVVGSINVQRVLRAYHKILSTQEPPEELVERVALAIAQFWAEGDSPADAALAAIKETWRGE